VAEVSPRFLRREWIAQALPFVWLLAMNMALMNLDTLVLGTLQGPGDVGVYRVVSQMAALVMFPLTAINLITAPKIAALYGARDLNSLQTTVRRGARLAFAGGAAMAILLVLLGRPALRMFGSEFEDGYKALVILVLGYLVNSAVGVAGYVLIMTRFERVAASMFMLAVLIDFTLCSLLIPRIGIDGAAIGTSASIMLLGLLMAVFANRRLGIDASAFSRPSDRD
jgi:O-antigen/teichoic acid export membrane protein